MLRRGRGRLPYLRRVRRPTRAEASRNPYHRYTALACMSPALSGVCRLAVLWMSSAPSALRIALPAAPRVTEVRYDVCEDCSSPRGGTVAGIPGGDVEADDDAVVTGSSGKP